MATPRTTSTDTRRRIVDAAYELFYKGGYARAGVDAIADMANVTKRTLYYHFESKDALLSAVLDVQHELMLARFGRWIKRASDDAALMIEQLFDEFATWAKSPGWRGSGFTRVAIELADAPGHPARAAARRHKAALELWLSEQLSTRGISASTQIAREIALLIEGGNALALIHGDPSYIETAGRTARGLVERYPPGFQPKPARSRRSR